MNAETVYNVFKALSEQEKQRLFKILEDNEGIKIESCIKRDNKKRTKNKLPKGWNETELVEQLLITRFTNNKKQ